MASLLITVISCLIIHCEAESMQVFLYENTAMADKLFLEHIIFTTTARSILDCARHCHLHVSCMTFTYIGGNCQGHSEFMTLTSTKTVVTGARYFARQLPVTEQVRCRTDGVQQLVVSSLDLSMQVFCDASWLVMLRRQDGSVDFYRDWQQYKNGFGNIQGDFWIGLEALHKITSTQNYNMAVDLEDWEGVTAYTTYTNFSVASVDDYYRLHLDFVEGTINDSLALHSGMQFSTYDADHDILSKTNCAVKLHGGWWYNKCAAANLCGEYKNSSHCPLKDCITWREWHGTYYSLKFVQVKIRPA